MSFRDVEDLLAQRGITVSYEAIRLWCIKFGPEYARGLKRRQGRLGDTWHLDEVFVTIQGQRQYLWRDRIAELTTRLSHAKTQAARVAGMSEAESTLKRYLGEPTIDIDD